MHSRYTESLDPAQTFNPGTSCRPLPNQEVKHWFGKPRIIESYRLYKCFDPVTKHSWVEAGELIGYQVAGGIWFRNQYPTLEEAEEELQRRVTELADRKAPGSQRNTPQLN